MIYLVTLQTKSTAQYDYQELGGYFKTIEVEAKTETLARIKAFQFAKQHPELEYYANLVVKIAEKQLSYKDLQNALKPYRNIIKTKLNAKKADLQAEYDRIQKIIKTKTKNCLTHEELVELMTTNPEARTLLRDYWNKPCVPNSVLAFQYTDACLKRMRDLGLFDPFAHNKLSELGKKLGARFAS